MKKLLAITLITLGVLIAGGYATTLYAEPTQAYETTDTLPAQPTSLAWGKGEVTPYYRECSGSWVATMTHTFNGRPCMIVDIEDTHLEWSGYMIPGKEYMINWTNISASAVGTGTFYLKAVVSGCEHLKRNNPDGATITTSYAMVTAGGAEPVRSNFIDAPDFNGNLPGTPVAGTEGKRVRYNQDLWARVVIDENDPKDIYEDEFYITFSIADTP